MGIVNHGIPREIVVQLARLAGATTFVETGTFQGNTTRWAAEMFESVHTIELSKVLYETYHEDLENTPGVIPHFGDSAKVMPEIVHSLGGEAALFWLDGHWSGGVTAGEEQECPVMEELLCLRDRNQDLILIDDARLFLCAPPLPHKAEQWPTIADISFVFGHDRFLQVIDDVIFIVPRQQKMKELLIGYAQAQAAEHLKQATPPTFHRLAKKLLGQ